MIKKLRPLGQVMQDMELLLREMTDEDQHDLQRYEVLHLINGWIELHAPQAIEEFEDGSNSKMEIK